MVNIISQWVCFVLFFQAGLFYVPRYLWKATEGGRVNMLAAVSINFISITNIVIRIIIIVIRVVIIFIRISIIVIRKNIPRLSPHYLQC